jgi:hypothetical protein
MSLRAPFLHKLPLPTYPTPPTHIPMQISSYPYPPHLYIPTQISSYPYVPHPTPPTHPYADLVHKLVTILPAEHLSQQQRVTLTQLVRACVGSRSGTARRANSTHSHRTPPSISRVPRLSKCVCDPRVMHLRGGQLDKMLGSTSQDMDGDLEATARRKAAEADLKREVAALGALPGLLSGTVIAYDFAVSEAGHGNGGAGREGMPSSGLGAQHRVQWCRVSSVLEWWWCCVGVASHAGHGAAHPAFGVRRDHHVQGVERHYCADLW